MQANLFHEGLRIFVMAVKAIFDMSPTGSLKIYASFLCEILKGSRSGTLPQRGKANDNLTNRFFAIGVKKFSNSNVKAD